MTTTMAMGKNRKKIAIRFEFGIAGLLGLGIVCFCIFLWMFLFGIWVGQAVLQPSPSGGANGSLAEYATSLLHRSGVEGGTDTSGIVESPEAVKPSVPEAGPAGIVTESDNTEPSFFSLQVGVFADEKRALQAVLAWRARGYESFSLPGQDSDDPSPRVFIGKFTDLSEANAMASELEKKNDTKAFITLLPALTDHNP